MVLVVLTPLKWVNEAPRLSSMTLAAQRLAMGLIRAPQI